MNNRLPWIILFLLVLFSSGCGGKGGKRIPPDLKNRIVFICSGTVCTVNSDGTDLQVIVSSDTAGPFSNPQWSPDKRRIAFNCKIEKRNRIMMVNFDGSDLKILGFSKPERKKKKTGILRLERWGDLYFEGWSPDGKYILFYHPVIDGSFVGLMNRNGRIRGELGGSHPDFLGRDKIVCVGHHGSVTAVGTDIYCAPIKGGDKQNLTRDGKLSYYGPVGSPDGERIAFGFRGPRSDGNGLWIMNTDGSNRRRLTCGDEDFREHYSTVISFSPDGNKILFLSAPYDSYKARVYPTGSIYIANADGNGLIRITDEIVKSRGGASWSPDGKQIVFTSGKDGNDELYVVNIDGTGLRRLTSSSAPDCCPDW